MSLAVSSQSPIESSVSGAPPKRTSLNILSTVQTPLKVLKELASRRATLEDREFTNQRTMLIGSIIAEEKPLPTIMKSTFLEAIGKGETDVASMIVDQYKDNLSNPHVRLISKAFSFAVELNSLASVKFLIEKFPEKCLDPENNSLESNLLKACFRKNFDIVEYFVKLPKIGYRLGALSRVYSQCPPEIQAKFPVIFKTEIEKYQRTSSLYASMAPGFMLAFLNIVCPVLAGPLKGKVTLSAFLKHLGPFYAKSIVAGLVAAGLGFATMLGVQKITTSLSFRELLNFSDDENKIVTNN